MNSNSKKVTIHSRIQRGIRMQSQTYFPLFIDLSEKTVVIIASGKEAEKKVMAMLPFTRHIVLAAGELTQELETLSMAGHITVLDRQIKKADLAGAFLVIAASGDRRLNDAVCRFCHEQGIYVNVKNRQEDSDFCFPGICCGEEIVVGVSTTSEDHYRARLLRTAIQKLIDYQEKNI